VWGDETVMQYLQEGVFHHWLPPCRHLHWKDPMGKPGCDWFGINHYARYGRRLSQSPAFTCCSDFCTLGTLALSV